MKNKMKVINRFLNSGNKTEIKAILPNISDDLLDIVFSGDSKSEAILYEQLQFHILKCEYCGSECNVFIEKRTYDQYICSACGNYFEDTLSEVRDVYRLS